MSDSKEQIDTTPASASEEVVEKKKGKAVEYLELDVDYNDVSEIESMCMMCHKNGVTRIMLIKIPHFKDVILMAFSCDECGHRSSDLRPGGAVSEEGCVITCHVKNEKDLNRQVVRSESAIITIPELDLTIPPSSENGSLNTIEGTLMVVFENLRDTQVARDAETRAALAPFIAKVHSFMMGDIPFTLIMDDPAGNSYIEAYDSTGAGKDSQIEKKFYERNQAQWEALGLQPPEEKEKTVITAGGTSTDVLEFPSHCPECKEPTIEKMYPTEIPYFKEVIIMATKCDNCGYKSNEIKSGGKMGSFARKTTLHITDPEDLNRDILKSNTALLSIPEIELELQPGSLGGRFTTIEGMLEDIGETLRMGNPFAAGDSAQGGDRDNLAKFLAKLKELQKFKSGPFTLILDDPCANSHIQNVYAPDADPELTEVDYPRTLEQLEDLGLVEMDVEGMDEELRAEVLAAREQKYGKKEEPKN